MSSTEYPEIRAQLPDMSSRAGHVLLTDYLRDARDVWVNYHPERETSWGATIEATVTARIGDTSITLPPDVWRIVLDTVAKALPPRPIWTPEDAAALRALAEEFPREVGESVALANLLSAEGLG